MPTKRLLRFESSTDAAGAEGMSPKRLADGCVGLFEQADAMTKAAPTIASVRGRQFITSPFPSSPELTRGSRLLNEFWPESVSGSFPLSMAATAGRVRLGPT